MGKGAIPARVRLPFCNVSVKTSRDAVTSGFKAILIWQARSRHSQREDTETNIRVFLQDGCGQGEKR